MEQSPVRVHLKNNSYDIHVQSQLLSCLDSFIDLNPYSSVFLLSNETVGPLYGSFVEDFCQKNAKPCTTYLMPDGEKYKSWDEAKKILDAVLDACLDRKSLIIALGGGVVGDIGGFVASLYMRGIAFVNIPTTLLACVDSSLGGKVAVNHPAMKNVFGSFYHPSSVVIDPQLLKTLDQRQYVSGLAEVIKYAIIWPSDLFSLLQKQRQALLNKDEKVLEEVIKRCCQIKALVVEKDEKEDSLRAILNFGHTLGHAIESATHYSQYLHGEAVAMGMVYAGYLAVQQGHLSKDLYTQIVDLIDAYGFVLEDRSLDWEILKPSLMRDKKFTFQNIRFILPSTIGKVDCYTDLTWENLEKAYEDMH